MRGTISLYSKVGELLAAKPYSTTKERQQIVKQWSEKWSGKQMGWYQVNPNAHPHEVRKTDGLNVGSVVQPYDFNRYRNGHGT